MDQSYFMGLRKFTVEEIEYNREIISYDGIKRMQTLMRMGKQMHQRMHAYRNTVTIDPTKNPILLWYQADADADADTHTWNYEVTIKPTRSKPIILRYMMDALTSLPLLIYFSWVYFVLVSVFQHARASDAQ